MAGRAGQCACGAVTFIATGAPKRIGLCHCRDCQRVHAAPAYHFAVYDRDQLSVSGVLASWGQTEPYDRQFCPTCGSHVLSFFKGDTEVSVECFDDYDALDPQYELWTIRRKPWLRALNVPQYERNREG